MRIINYNHIRTGCTSAHHAKILPIGTYIFFDLFTKIIIILLIEIKIYHTVVCNNIAVQCSVRIKCVPKISCM